MLIKLVKGRLGLGKEPLGGGDAVMANVYEVVGQVGLGGRGLDDAPGHADLRRVRADLAMRRRPARRMSAQSEARIGVEGPESSPASTSSSMAERALARALAS